MNGERTKRTIDPRIREMPRVGPAGYDPALDELRLVDGKPGKVDRLGNPLTLREWVTAFENDGEGGWRDSYRDVAYDEFGQNEAGGPARTVWTSWTGLVGPARGAWTTAIFAERGEKAGDAFDILAELHADTEEVALAQHEKALEGVRRGHW